MAGPELFQVFIRPLNLLNIPYMVTGSVASIVYGEARMTHDIDMVVMIRVHDAECIAEAFPSTDFYCPPKEIIRIEAKRPLRHYPTEIVGRSSATDPEEGGKPSKKCHESLNQSNAALRFRQSGWQRVSSE